MALPTVPPSFSRQLEQFDRRLRARFGEDGLWHIDRYSDREGRFLQVWTWGHWSVDLGRFLYRPLPDSAQPVIEQLAKGDLARMGPSAAQRMLDTIDGSRAAFEAKRRAESSDRRRQELHDKIMRLRGIRKTFAVVKPS